MALPEFEISRLSAPAVTEAVFGLCREPGALNGVGVRCCPYGG